MQNLSARPVVAPREARIVGIHFMMDAVFDKQWLLRQSCASWRSILRALAQQFGMAWIGEWGHDFDARGALSAGLILGTSHATVHTWPEHNYAAIDVFSCNTETVINPSDALLCFPVRPVSHEIFIVNRRIPRLDVNEKTEATAHK